MHRLRPLLAAAVLALSCADEAAQHERTLARVAELEDLREGDSQELHSLAESPDPAIRQRVMVALGRIQDPADLPVLIEHLDDASPAVADAALFAIGQLGLMRGVALPPAAAASVAPLLDDPRTERAALAVEALGKLAPAEGAELLLARLDHSEAAVRAEVAHALFRLRFAPRWRGEVEQEPAAAAGATEALVTLLTDAETTVRRAAAHAFSRQPEAAAGPVLLPRIADDDEWVRFFAVRAIGRLGREAAPPGAATAVAEAAADPSPLVRREAVAALGALGAVELAPIEVARDGSAHVRAALAAALATEDSADSLSLLERLERDDPSAEVRSAALAALATRLGNAASERLRERLASEDPRIRATVARALPVVSEQDRADLAPRLLSDPARPVRLAALETLGTDPLASSALTAALQADDLAERGTAIEVVAGLEPSPERTARLRAAFARSGGDDWVEVREAIVDALDDDASFLGDAVRDHAPAVRFRAAAALRRLGGDPPMVETAADSPSRFLDADLPAGPRVVFETERGRVVIEGLAEAAPVHVASLLALVEAGFYDGLTVHRVVPGFVVQGGDPRGDGWGGPDFQLRDEISRVRLDRGMVGMAKAGKDTGGSQFFITLAPTPHLDGNYTVYGRVVEGMEVVDALEVGDRIVKVVRGDRENGP